MLSKTHLISFILLFSISLFGQEALNKGVFTLSGSMTYTSSSSTTNFLNIENKTDNLTIGISPSFGYFIIDNLLIKSNLFFHYNEQTSYYNSFTPSLIDLSEDISRTNISRDYTIGIGLKYYFRLSGFNPFISADYGYSNAITGNNDANTYTFSVGLNYFISKSVALEPFVHYSKRTKMSSVQLLSNSSSQTTNKNSNTSFGIRIVFFVVD